MNDKTPIEITIEGPGGILDKYIVAIIQLFDVNNYEIEADHDNIDYSQCLNTADIHKIVIKSKPLPWGG